MNFFKQSLSSKLPFKKKPPPPPPPPQQDALDKGVDAVLKKLGRGQSIETTEKISDGVRVMFKKTTGRDIPIPDKQ